MTSMNSSWRYFLPIFLAVCYQTAAEDNDVRARLLTRVIMSYSTFLSPADGQEPLHVCVSLSLKHIRKVDEERGTATFQLFLQQNWTDSKIRWDRAEFNISEAYTPRRILWTPDIVERNGGSVDANLSRDLRIQENGQVIDVRAMEVTLPCRRTGQQLTNAPSKDENKEKKKGLICSLVIGSWIESLKDLVFEPGVADASHLQTNTSATWRLDDILAYNASEPTSFGPEEFSVAIFDFIFVKDITLDYLTTVQLLVPSVLTSLGATFVFSLPPLSPERISVVGMCFIGQLVLSGFNVLAQIQSSSIADLRDFMLFSVGYVFLLIIAVLLSFFAYPFLKKPAPASETDSCEVQTKLLQMPERRLAASTPDIVLFVVFIAFYCIGLGTIFS